MATKSRTLLAALVAVLALVTLLAGSPASASTPPTTMTQCTHLLQTGKLKNDDATTAACKKIEEQQCGEKVAAGQQLACDLWTYLTSAGSGTCDGVPPGPLHAACSETNSVAHVAGGAAKVVTDPAGAASSLASAGFDAVAGKFGSAAASILQQLTKVFLHVSSIDLTTAGISGKDSLYSLTWALSAMIAILLLLWQFAKLALTGQGQAGATAITGLVKWALICVATMAVTDTALKTTDAISNGIIDWSYKEGGKKAFEQHINDGFGKFFTTPQENTAIVFLFGVLAILVVLVLWGEMLLRQAALQVLLVVMPIVAAGSMMDATREWWPKARNAVISLILIKPIIVLIFVIGFRETGQSSDTQSFLVGLLTIVLGGLAWPSLARFMTFTTVGSGGGLASGLLGAAGGTAGSMFMYGGGVPSGAGAVGGGAGFTKAVESENDASVAAGAGRARRSGVASGAAGAASGGLLTAAAMGAQAAKAGKEMAEGGMEAMAAHADLGPGKDMGGQVNVPGGLRGGDAEPPAPVPQPRPDAPPPSEPPGSGGQIPISATPTPPQVTGANPPQIAPPQTPQALPPAQRPTPALPPAPRPSDGQGSNP